MNTTNHDDINYKNNPLHSVGLKKMIVELSEHYGFEILFAYLNINCFRNNPSVASSVKFLKKTDWAREKVESFYLYTYKNLPKAARDQYQLSPRDRIIPDDQYAGEPKELSLEEAARLREERETKAAEFDAKSGHGGAKKKQTDQKSRRSGSGNTPYPSNDKYPNKDKRNTSTSSRRSSTKRSNSTPDNPWGLPRD